MRGHVDTGLPHRLNYLIQSDLVRAIAVHRQFGRIDSFHSPHRIALDAWNLHQPAYRVTCKTQVVLHANLSRFFDVIIVSSECGSQSTVTVELEQRRAERALRQIPNELVRTLLRVPFRAI